MKILYYSPHPNINMAAPSGPGTHIREVIRAFEQQGHEVVRLIAGGENLSGTSPIHFRKRWYRRLIPTIVWNTLKDWKLLRFDKGLKQELANLVQSEKPDVIYERAYYLMNSGYTVARSENVRYICEINAPYPQEKTAMEGASLYFHAAQGNEKKQVLTADHVIVVSSALKDYLVQGTGVLPEKIVVTPNAVNPAHIHVDNELLKRIRTQLGWQPSDQVIGFVGSIFPYHGVDILLEAFSSLKKMGLSNIRLLIVGDGETLPELKQEALAAGYADTTWFAGNVPHADIYTYIAAMDIAVMAKSNWYGSPVKLFEYGAMKKFVIAPDQIPVHDIMEDKVHGFIIKPTREALTDAILRALNDPVTAGKMARQFHERVMTKHTWDQVGIQILSAHK